jgi:thiamine biosynthesis lipoprotein
LIILQLNNDHDTCTAFRHLADSATSYTALVVTLLSLTLSVTESSLMPHLVVRPLVLQLLAITGLGSAMTLHAQTAYPTAQLSQPSTVASHRFHQDHVLGTSLEMLVVGGNAADAKRAYTAASREITRLDQILSTYKNDSEISTLNQQQDGKSTAVSADLYKVLHACEAWHSVSCGAFSARLGQLILAKQHNPDIDAQALALLANNAATATVTLDPSTQYITRPAGVVFAPDALAKGYIIDRALAAARHAVPHARGLMLDIGGDIQVWGQAPRASGWQVGLRGAGQRADNETPQQVLSLKTSQRQPLSVAYSGQGARDVLRSGGQRDSHLLAPTTGQALNHIEHSIVVAPSAADADALATAIAAMQPAQAMALIDTLEGSAAQLTLTDGQTFTSSNWQDLVATEHTVATMRTVVSTDSSKSALWPSGYRAMLDYDIPKLASPNYQAPYVIIWVTDSERKLVRTLHVFGNDKKWQDSNYLWWKRYGRSMTTLDSVAKPSRAPGHYSVAWDGKDDAGNTVAAGKYLLHIEAAREHGGHSYQSFDIDASPTTSNQTLPAKDEFGALVYRFGRAI